MALSERALPPARTLALRNLVDPNDHQRLDSALVAIFNAPDSATGEDVAELHLHGGSAVVAGVLQVLTAMPGLVLAEPGEFTRRAFANGRLDLSQVEGLADLVAAETASQRNQALALSGGALSRLADAWRRRCIGLLAEAEAGLDFAEDEADVAARIDLQTHDALLGLVTELETLLADAERAARIRDGLTIAVVGAPNVGKSSLVNALAMKDAAIVTNIAGTTRDAIEVALDLGGVAVTIVDTAGLRETDDVIEREGIKRTRARAASADMVLQIIAAGDVLPVSMARSMLVINKVDLGSGVVPVNVQAVSALTGQGMQQLRQALVDWARDVTRPGEPALLAHARHRAAFQDASAALQSAANTDVAVLRTESLRVATQAFGRIAGRVAVDDVLDQIFSRFCIGK